MERIGLERFYVNDFSIKSTAWLCIKTYAQFSPAEAFNQTYSLGPRQLQRSRSNLYYPAWLWLDSPGEKKDNERLPRMKAPMLLTRVSPSNVSSIIKRSPLPGLSVSFSNAYQTYLLPYFSLHHIISFLSCAVHFVITKGQLVDLEELMESKKWQWMLFGSIPDSLRWTRAGWTRTRARLVLASGIK